MISVEWPKDGSPSYETWVRIAKNFEDALTAKDADLASAQEEIARLKKENEALRAALWPFARVFVPSGWPDDEVTLDESLTAGDFRRVARALSPDTQPEHGGAL